MTLLILGAGFAIFGLTPALFVTMYVGMIAAIVAIPYTALAVISREFNARQGVGGRDGPPEISDDAMRFRMFRQRASMVNATVMLGALIAMLALPRTSSQQSGLGVSPLPDGSLLVFGAFAIVAGVLAMVVNAPSIYSRAIARSERHAIRRRVGAWKLILANTILTTASWIAYCGFAVHFLSEAA